MLTRPNSRVPPRAMDGSKTPNSRSYRANSAELDWTVQGPYMYRYFRFPLKMNNAFFFFSPIKGETKNGRKLRGLLLPPGDGFMRNVIYKFTIIFLYMHNVI